MGNICTQCKKTCTHTMTNFLEPRFQKPGTAKQILLSSGMACCWSIKNPEYPERVFKTSSGITALDFSLQNPNLLAVGMYNGTIAVYNVRFSSQLAVCQTLNVLCLYWLNLVTRFLIVPLKLSIFFCSLS